MNAGRLKRETVVSNTQGATEINRMGGRIIRSNERTGTGGSIVVSNTTDMNMHKVQSDSFIYLNFSNKSFECTESSKCNFNP